MEITNINDVKLVNLLNEIESFLTKQSHYTYDIIAFIKSLIKIYFNSDINSFFLFLTNLNSEKKQIYFMRHGQSTYNMWRSEKCYNFPCFYRNKTENHDPKLTINGRDQIDREYEKFKKKYDNIKGFDIMFVSPLTRALQTCLLMKEKFTDFDDKTEILCTDLLRERLDYACDIGTKKNQLENEFNDINFKFIYDDVWWFNKKDNNNNNKPDLSENKISVRIRCFLTIFWILIRKEEKILIVSHKNIHNNIFNCDNFFGKTARNAEICFLDKNKIDCFFTNIQSILKKI